MRNKNLYIVFDERAKVIIGNIIHDHSEVPIVRGLSDAVNNKETMISRSPEDFTIYEIGTVDEETGMLDAIQPKIITTALALRAVTQ